MIGATAKPLYAIDGKGEGLDRRTPQTSLLEGGGPPCGRWKEFSVEAIPPPQRRQDFAKFTFHEVLLFFLFFVRFQPLFFARHFTSSMVRSHTFVPVGPVTIRPSVWRSRL